MCWLACLSRLQARTTPAGLPVHQNKKIPEQPLIDIDHPLSLSQWNLDILWPASFRFSRRSINKHCYSPSGRPRPRYHYLYYYNLYHSHPTKEIYIYIYKRKKEKNQGKKILQSGRFSCLSHEKSAWAYPSINHSLTAGLDTSRPDAIATAPGTSFFLSRNGFSILKRQRLPAKFLNQGPPVQGNLAKLRLFALTFTPSHPSYRLANPFIQSFWFCLLWYTD